jgi:hypothetical protein
MKRLVYIISFSIILSLLFPNQIYQNYVQVYGEGPVGRHLVGFNVIVYSKEDGVELARKEIMEFLSGCIYGYSFIYKVENKLSHSEGYFDLIPLVKLKENDINLTLTQLEENDLTLRLQAKYRLTDDQKNYIMGFQSSIAKFSMGEASEKIDKDWSKRLEIYKNAIRNSVLNEAKKRLKARPLYIKGRILLIESPTTGIISGEWNIRVKTHVIINEITYEDVY